MKAERTEESSRSTESTEEEQTSTSDKSTEPDSATEATLQQQINMLKREYIETRGNTVNWWLRFIAISLSFFGFVILISSVTIGFLAFERFKDLETTAKGHLQEILKHRRTAEEVLREDAYGTLIDYSDNRSEDIGFIQSPEETHRIKEAIQNIKYNPDSFLIDRAIADAYTLRLNGKFTEAREKWEAIVNLTEENDNKLAALAWYWIAGTYRGKQKAKEALNAYNKAIELRPIYPSAFNNRGTVNVRLDNYDDAFEDYGTAIQQDPTFHIAYINRGNLKVRLGRHKSAIDDYNIVIDDLNWEWSNVYLSRGRAHAHIGNISKAKSDLETGLAIAIRYGDNYLIVEFKRTIQELKLDSRK